MERTGWKQVAVLAVGLVVVSALPSYGAEAGAPTAPLSVLEEILGIMRQHGQITEAQRQSLLERAQREARQAKADQERAVKETTSILMAGIENYKPFLRSGDGNFKLELGGRVQMNFAGAEDDAVTLGGTDLVDRFFVRRARLDMGGTLFNWIDFRIEGEFTEANVVLKDAYVDFRVLPLLAVRAGQFKQPFSREELQSDNLIDFVERSVINELSPSRDFGMMVFGSLADRIVSYQVSLANGTGEDTADNNDAKDVAGRLVLAPFRTTTIGVLKNLEVAGNATWGDEFNLAGAQGRTAGRFPSRFVYFAAQPSRGDRTRYGADLAWAWGPLGLVFEWAEQRNERTGLGPGSAKPDLDDIVASGWYIAATWLITGETKTIGGIVVPRRNFSPFTGRWGPGAWQLGVRYATLEFSSDDPVDFFDGNIANGIPGGGRTADNGVDALTVGLNWYLNPRVRAMANWTRYWFDNDLGTPFSCTLRTCTGGTLQPGGDAYEIETSVQVWF